MSKVPLTVRGEALLLEELKELKSVKRPRVIQAIADAREHGDLKENAEYHAAREEQGFIEGRIQDIEGKLGNSQVIDVTKLNPNGKVVFGTTVVLSDLESEDETTYQIVGDDEADLKAGRISYGSPVAKAMIGKEEGDIVGVQAPGGVREYEIMSVQYV